MSDISVAIGVTINASRYEAALASIATATNRQIGALASAFAALNGVAGAAEAVRNAASQITSSFGEIGNAASKSLDTASGAIAKTADDGSKALSVFDTIGKTASTMAPLFQPNAFFMTKERSQTYSSMEFL